jgi:hypothetical protein
MLAVAQDGSERWLRRYGTTSADWFSDNAGTLVTGSLRGTSTLGGPAISPVAGSNYALVLAQYGADGSHEWSRGYGGSATETPLLVSTGSDGVICVAGGYTGTASLGGTPFSGGAGSRYFVATYDSLGGHLWSRDLPFIPTDLVALDTRQCVVAGQFANTLTVDREYTADGTDGIVVHYGADGPIRSLRATGPGLQVFARLARRPTGGWWMYGKHSAALSIEGFSAPARSTQSAFVVTTDDALSVATGISLEQGGTGLTVAGSLSELVVHQGNPVLAMQLPDGLVVDGTTYGPAVLTGLSDVLTPAWAYAVRPSAADEAVVVLGVESRGDQLFVLVGLQGTIMFAGREIRAPENQLVLLGLRLR